MLSQLANVFVNPEYLVNTVLLSCCVIGSSFPVVLCVVILLKISLFNSCRLDIMETVACFVSEFCVLYVYDDLAAFNKSQTLSLRLSPYCFCLDYLFSSHF